MNIKDFKKELYKNPVFKEEFEKYDLAFEVGQMLIEARIIKGITQEKLALLIGTQQSGIARAEKGTTLPSLSYLERVAKALKTNLIVKFGFMDEYSFKFHEHSSEFRRTEVANVISTSFELSTIDYSQLTSLTPCSRKEHLSC